MNQKKSFETAVSIVIKHYDITEEELCSKSREKLYIDARLMVIGILHKNNVYGSLKKLGSRLGGRTHATIINALRNLDDYIETDKSTMQLFDRLNNKFQQLCI